MHARARVVGRGNDICLQAILQAHDHAAAGPGRTALQPEYCAAVHAHGIQQPGPGLPKTRVLGNLVTWLVFLTLGGVLIFEFINHI